MTRWCSGRALDSCATTLCKLFTPNVPLFTKQYNLVPCEGLHAKKRRIVGSGIGSNGQGGYCRAVLQWSSDCIEPQYKSSALPLPYHICVAVLSCEKLTVKKVGDLGKVAMFQFLPARRYASAGNSDRNVSVCLSITRRYCVKTKKASSMISSPSGSPKTLVFWRQISSPNSEGFLPNEGLKQRLVGKIQRFSRFKRQYLENGSRYGQSYY